MAPTSEQTPVGPDLEIALVICQMLDGEVEHGQRMLRGHAGHAVDDCGETAVDRMVCEDVTTKSSRQVGGKCGDVHPTPYPAVIRRHSTCLRAL